MQRDLDYFLSPSKFLHNAPRRSRPNIQTQTKVFEPHHIYLKKQHTKPKGFVWSL